MQEARQDDADPRGEAWRSPLDELERTVTELAKALGSLRRSLEAPVLKEVPPPGEAVERSFAPEPPTTRAPQVEAPEEVPAAPEQEHDIASGASGFKDVWDRLQRERQEREQSGDDDDLDGLRGLGELPQDYRITIEDKDGTPVDLVPIHRALLTFAQPADVSLMSFANGVPVVSIRTHGELDLDKLGETIGTATSRECEVIQQDRGKLFLRLSNDEGKQS